MPWRGSVKSARLDHVVLLVAAQAVLRAEGGGEAQIAERGERVERMRQVGGHRRRMGEQGDAAAARAARAGRARRAGDRGRSASARRLARLQAQREAVGVMEVGTRRGVAQRPVRVARRRAFRSPPPGRGAAAVGAGDDGGEGRGDRRRAARTVAGAARRRIEVDALAVGGEGVGRPAGRSGEKLSSW